MCLVKPPSELLSNTNLSRLQIKQMFFLSSSLAFFRSRSYAKVSMMIPKRIFEIMILTITKNATSDAHLNQNLV